MTPPGPVTSQVISSVEEDQSFACSGSRGAVCSCRHHVRGVLRRRAGRPSGRPGRGALAVQAVGGTREERRTILKQSNVNGFHHIDKSTRVPTRSTDGTACPRTGEGPPAMCTDMDAEWPFAIDMTSGHVRQHA